MSALYCDPGPPPNAGRKVMLSTTVYDSPDSSYTYSIARSREALAQAGIPTAYLILSGNCHVDDARNTVVRDFLASDCSDLVFLDADVSWEPEALVKICQYDCDVVGGVYPYRREGSGPKMPVRNLPGQFEPDREGLLEVEGLPTGFLRIKRHVLEKLAAKAPSFKKDNQAAIPIIFERDLHEDGRRGGDIGFCMKWREMGGKVFAAADLYLGHCGKQVIRDSLAACLRRRFGTTLKYVADRVREGSETRETFLEAYKAVENKFAAQADVLSLAVLLARKARGPIIEAGSGLSTVLMAAANPDVRVWAIEHSPHYAQHTAMMARSAEVTNIALITCEIKDGWYDLGDDWSELPKKFAVGLLDGPPRMLGDRMRFLEHFGQSTKVILVDDADDKQYASKLSAWAEANSRHIEFGDHRAAVIR